MSRKAKTLAQFMIKAMGTFVRFVENQRGLADKMYVAQFAPVLLRLIDEMDTADVKLEWRKLNGIAYKANKISKGDSAYNMAAKRASMLLAIGLDGEDTLRDLHRNYTSLQGVYVALKGGKSKSKTAATRKPITFRQRVVNLLASGTPAQRKMVADNFKAILAAASEK